MQHAIEHLRTALAEHGYICDEDLATTLTLMDSLQRPLLIEGEAGVGKTEIAKALSGIKHYPLIRLQCYEGLTANEAIYEWNYNKQLLSLQSSDATTDSSVFSETYLLERPLLQAIRHSLRTVLLIDEIDRADDAFEAFLLELLSDFQITIPEIGTITANHKPMVILTSNHTRDLSDALRRRCLYHYLDFPDYEKELHIVKMHNQEISQKLAEQIVLFMQALRQEDIRKKPGIAETVDWAQALSGLDVENLIKSEATIFNTLSCLFKHQEDRERFTGSKIKQILNGIAQ